MFKVIIADDHIPVLTYLSTNIPWTELGLELSAACSDGGEALEACERCRPDILITDIGMPVMNGLDLIDHSRRINPRLKAVILSCHEDFQYAQQAVKLHVSDYILKESLRIEQLIAVLQQLAAHLREETALQETNRNLQDVVKQSSTAIRATFLRSLLEQPIWNETDLQRNAKKFGIHLHGSIPYLPVLAVPDRPSLLEERFGGAHNMQFVIDNALHDLLRMEGSFVLPLDERHAFLLFLLQRTLKRNVHDEIREELQHIQQSMNRYMRLSLSFFIGNASQNLGELKKRVLELLHIKTIRFYSGEQCIVKAAQQLETAGDDIFVHYSEAMHHFRTSILSGNKAETVAAVAKWIHHIETMRYPVDAVRSWFLNIAMELELKFTVMQNFITNFDAERLHKTIYSIDTLVHLNEWMEHFLEQKMTSMQTLRHQSMRKEIAEAIRYVLMHPGEKISMEEMANRFNLNPTHFSRVFKHETGETFIEFVTRTKMERARELLSQSDLTVHEIAERLGFDHTSYFIKVFRNYSGKSPVEYRKTI